MTWKIISMIGIMILLHSCTESTPFKIEVFVSQNENSKHHYHPSTKSFNYLIEGYNGSIMQADSITKFVCSSLDSSYFEYHTFWVSFYKKSKKTNNENIRKNPKDFFRYSTFHDILFQYKFTKTGVRTKSSYNNSENPFKYENFKCK